MSTYVRSTKWEEEVIKGRMSEYLPALVHIPPVALQRYAISSEAASEGFIIVHCETNDDNDDGYPDGHWESWDEEFPSVEKALANKGKCRVGISGVIVTVLLDGKEVR